MRYLLICLFSFVSLQLFCQRQEVKLTIIYDANRGSTGFLSLVQSEIDALLKSRYQLTYRIIGLEEGKAETTLNQALDDDSDILVTLGFYASGSLNSIGAYPKPCIAGISLDRSDEETTGIQNYNAIQSPFSIERDMEVFQSIYPFKHLGVFVYPDLRLGVENYLSSFEEGFDIQFIPISEDPTADLNQLHDEVDAIYLLPNLYDNLDHEQILIDGINSRKLPSFSLIGRLDVERGILASVSPSDYIGVYARRIALSVMKILEGQNAGDLPTHIGGIEEDFVINVATMEAIEMYPPLEVLSQASLIDLINKTGRKYTLEGAIAEALTNNLSFRAAQKNVEVQELEVDIARSNLLPDVTASTTLSTLDKNTAELLKSANQLTPQTSWAGNLGLTQLIYAEPAWANKTIQNALLLAEQEGLISEQLDLVLNVCTSYIQYLQAQANVTIQNNNVQTTLSNLNIAKTKANIGNISLADVYGFESQLAINRSSLNDAQTALDQARIAFNQLLNHPLDEPIVLNDIQVDDPLIFVSDSRLRDQVKNHYDFEALAEFLVDYALRKAPEIKQLNWNIKAQQRSLRSNKNSLFQPQVALQGNLDQNFGRYGIRVPDETFEARDFDPYQPTWNLGVSASLPLFQGNLRRNRIEKDKVLLEQLDLRKQALEQNFDTNIRLALENLGNSYNNLRLTQQAEASSLQYLEIIQDLYREGVTTIVTLLDAQNNALISQLSVVSSRYQFFIDAITIERQLSILYLLSTQEERDQFINEYFNYFIQKRDNE